MGAMAGRGALLAVMLALATAGCGSPQAAALPPACVDEPPASIATALGGAPSPVALPDGTRLSACVHLAARKEGDLQAMGVALTRVADALREQAMSDPSAALRLGYLVGAVRRGAARTPGIAAQLARRIEQLAAIDGAGQRSRDALQRGIRLGESAG